MTTAIPRITDPLGRYWDQPPLEEIELDETHALMTPYTFRALADYSNSRPTGAYPGKMWRTRLGDRWFLRWYAVDPSDSDFLLVHYREIILAESNRVS